MRLNRNLIIACLVVFSIILSSCAAPANQPTAPVNENKAPASAGSPFRILAASEFKALEPLIKDYFTQNNLPAPVITYKGSLEISNMLKVNDVKDFGYDAVWASNSIWIDLGDVHKYTKNRRSIMRTPVALGVKISKAKELGWVGKPVTMNDILVASEAKKLKFVMSSATQSNSGASAYLGILNAFNNEQMLTSETLDNKDLREKVRRMMHEVNRSSASSSELNSFFVKNYANYDAEFNYESLIIAANRGEVAGVKLPEPIYVVYPADGLAISDGAMAYVDHGDAERAKVYAGLQEHLLSPVVQERIQGFGWRTGLGVNIANPNTAIFNPAWGVNTTSTLVGMRFPRAEVIDKALTLYQVAFRKPSFTVYCLDVSNSMAEVVNGQTGMDQLKTAMAGVLDPKQTKDARIQPSVGDVTVVIPFGAQLVGEWRVKGNTPADLENLLNNRIMNMKPIDGTGIFSAVDRAFFVISKEKNLEDYFPSVVVMTDGQNNAGITIDQLQTDYKDFGFGPERPVPVIAITFGVADDSQMNGMASFTTGTVVDGRGDLKKAFLRAKGYN